MLVAGLAAREAELLDRKRSREEKRKRLALERKRARERRARDSREAVTGRRGRSRGDGAASAAGDVRRELGGGDRFDSFWGDGLPEQAVYSGAEADGMGDELRSLADPATELPSFPSSQAELAWPPLTDALRDWRSLHEHRPHQHTPLGRAHRLSASAGPADQRTFAEPPRRASLPAGLVPLRAALSCDAAGAGCCRASLEGQHAPLAAHVLIYARPPRRLDRRHLDGLELVLSPPLGPRLSSAEAAAARAVALRLPSRSVRAAQHVGRGRWMMPANTSVRGLAICRRDAPGVPRLALEQLVVELLVPVRHSRPTSRDAPGPPNTTDHGRDGSADDDPRRWHRHWPARLTDEGGLVLVLVCAAQALALVALCGAYLCGRLPK